MLLLELLHPDWHQQARCASQTELMYSEHAGQAKALCRKCAVRDHCLAEALERREPEAVEGWANEGAALVAAAITGQEGSVTE